MAKKARQAKSTQKQAIPDDVKVRVNEIVEAFNKSEVKAKQHQYVTRFQGKYLYLDRLDYGVPTRICRLTYTEDIDNWDFAIYRHSKERYDPDEGLFPGDEYVNGTIEGAMRAGLAAYPPAPALAGIGRYSTRVRLPAHPSSYVAHHTIATGFCEIETEEGVSVDDPRYYARGGF